MEELENYNSGINGDELDRLEELKCHLEYFFMDPIKKWRHKNTRPWKLVVQILKIFVFTSQLVIFGSDMAKFINYKEELQVTLKQTFLRDWDPSSEAIPYPGPYIPYAVYTKQDFIRSVNYAIKVYSNISDSGVGQFGYQSNSSDVLSPIEICFTDYVQADFDPSRSRFNFSIYTVTNCKTIEGYAPAGSKEWLEFDFRSHIQKPIDFSSLVSTTIKMPLRTILMEDATSGYAEIVCFDIDVTVFYDNRHRNGQIVINLIGIPRQAKCRGHLVENTGSDYLSRRMLNVFVILFCVVSFSLCARSLARTMHLIKHTEKLLRSHGRKLLWTDKIEFMDFWLILIILNDLLVGFATVIITFYDRKLLETDSHTTCSLLLGLGNFLSWSGLLRYLSFFKKYNLLLVTLRKSFLHVVRFMLCTTIIYCGFCFCGWIVFGPYHFKFRELSTTTECLFALINGDDMFETFALLRSNIGPIWWFSRIYLYVFVSLFIYVVLSLFIALIMDAYEMIKQYSENGFPRSRLESFYLDGDMTKLTSIF